MKRGTRNASHHTFSLVWAELKFEEDPPALGAGGISLFAGGALAEGVAVVANVVADVPTTEMLEGSALDEPDRVAGVVGVEDGEGVPEGTLRISERVEAISDAIDERMLDICGGLGVPVVSRVVAVGGVGAEDGFTTVEAPDEGRTMDDGSGMINVCDADIVGMGIVPEIVVPGPGTIAVPEDGATGYETADELPGGGTMTDADAEGTG